MKATIAVFALLAVAAANAGVALPATLLPKVNIAPAQVNIVKQPITVTQPELVYRHVPVPVRAVQYTAPAVVPSPVIATHAIAAPAIATHAIAAPAIATHALAAPAIATHGLAAPAIATHGLAAGHISLL